MALTFQHTDSDIILVRKQEEKNLLEALKNQLNSFVYGLHGIGKTRLIRKVASEYRDRFGNAIYVDCNMFKTTNAILKEILLSLGVVVSSRSNYELIKRLKSKIKKYKLLVILDHFENLNQNEILELALSLNISLLLVSDSFDCYRKMTLPIRSQITNILKIQEPSAQEVYHIIKESNPDLSDEKIKAVINKTHENLTLALNIINSLKTIPSQCHRNYLDQFFQIDSTSKLNEDERLLVQILKDYKRLPGGELYDIYVKKSKSPKSKRAFRKYMLSISKRGFVRPIGEKRGRLYEIVDEKNGCICD